MKKIIIGLICLLVLVLIGCTKEPEEKGFDELLEEDRQLHYTGGYCEGFCEAQDLEVKMFNITDCECKDKEPEIELKDNLNLGSADSIFSNVNLSTFSPSSNYIFQSMDANITFMNMTCHQVRCKCMDWGCLAYCMSCELTT